MLGGHHTQRTSKDKEFPEDTGKLEATQIVWNVAVLEQYFGGPLLPPQKNYDLRGKSPFTLPYALLLHLMATNPQLQR